MKASEVQNCKHWPTWNWFTFCCKRAHDTKRDWCSSLSGTDRATTIDWCTAPDWGSVEARRERNGGKLMQWQNVWKGIWACVRAHASKLRKDTSQNKIRTQQTNWGKNQRFSRISSALSTGTYSELRWLQKTVDPNLCKDWTRVSWYCQGHTRLAESTF